MIVKRKFILEKVSTLKIDFLKGTGEVKNLKRDGLFCLNCIICSTKT